MLMTHTKDSNSHFSTGVNDEQFSIEMTREAFDALSGRNLYKNIILALVRELSCNAYDAHLAAGNADSPFYIHVPTQTELYFSIRDYGTGLDDTEVRDVYRTFFKSTKRQDANSIGAWGLGSKTPLGYTSNFSVNAFKDGVKRSYTVFKNENGIPSISLLAEQSTTEPNGLEVSVPVQLTDIYSFNSEVKTALQYFPVKPVSNVEIIYKEKDFVYENIIEGVSLIKKSYYKTTPVAIHGYIEYPINLPDKDKISSDVRYLLDFPFIIHVPIGSLSVSMSREQLSYDDKTIKTIESLLRDIHGGLKNVFFTVLHGLSDYDKACVINKNINEKDESVFKRVALEIKSTRPNTIFHDIVHEKTDSWFNSIPFQETEKNKINDDHGIYLNVYYNKKGIMARTGVHKKITLDTRNLFVVNDTRRAALPSIRKYVRESAQDYSWVYVFSAKKGALDSNAAEYIIEKLQNPRMLRLSSSMPFSSVNKRTGTVKKQYASGSILCMKNGKWHSVQPDHQFDGKKIYVDLENTTSKITILGKSHFFSSRNVYDLTKIMSHIGLMTVDDVIHGVRKSSKKKVENDSSWVSLSSEIEKFILNNEKNIKTLSYSLYGLNPHWSNYPEILNIVDDSGVIREYKQCTEDSLSRKKIELISMFVDISKDVSETTELINKSFQLVSEQYPLLGSMSSFRYDRVILSELLLYLAAKKEQIGS